MNYTNEVRNEEMPNNNRAYKGINYNPNNIKIPRRKNKIKTDNNNNYQEIKEFKSQEDLVFLKKLKPTKSFEPYIKSGSKNIVNNKMNMNNEYNEFNDYNEYNDQFVNKGINKTNVKSNSSIKINTKVNCKKYFTSKKMGNNNENMSNQISNNNKEVINSNLNNNVSSNHYNIVYPGQNSVKMKGKKMINYYNNVNNNNKNNNLTMTKSSIQIKGNYPLTQSQNIYQYHTQSKVESIALNVDVDNNNNGSKDKYIRRENIENSNNKARSIQNRYINNQNYTNKTHLVKREFNNKAINYDNNNNNLTPKLVQNKNIKVNSNYNLMENVENRTNRINNNYANYNYNISNSNRSNKTIHKIKNNLARTTQVEMEKENQFVKNNNDEYNNIFFYTCNTNKNTNTNANYNNELNENKYNYQYKEKSDFIYNAFDDDNNIYNNNNNINIISNKKENKMKKQFVYKKSGNLSDNKIQKLITNKNNSQSKPSINNNNEPQNIEKLQNNLTKGKKTINRINKNVKRDKSNEIIPLKSKRSYEIKKRQFKENKNVKNYTIKKHEMKLRKKKSFDIIDIKIKVPPDDKEEIISINIKKGNIGEGIENIINQFNLDESYYEPLLSLVNNSINILNNIDNMKIYKSVKNENEKLGKENEEVTSSEINNLNLSVIIDLIEKNKFKEYIEDIYSDNEEIIDNAKILNLSI